MIKFSDSVIQQSRNMLLDQLDLTGVQEEEIKKLEADIKAVLVEHDEQASNINSDADLSGHGRATHTAQLSQSTSERLHRLTDSRVKQLYSRLAELQQQLEKPPRIENPVLQFLMEKECRDLLREQDELTVMGNYQSWAVSGGNDTAMQAVENAPSFAPLISDPATLDAGRRARQTRHSPQAAEALASVQKLLRMVTTLVNQGEAHLNLPPADPVAEIAKGES